MNNGPYDPWNPPPGAMPPPPQAPNPYAPPQTPYAAPYAAPYGQYQLVEDKIPGKVVAGFVLSFLCPIVGLILCILGGKEIGPSGRGRGLATAGIVISVINGAIGVLMNLAQM